MPSGEKLSTPQATVFQSLESRARGQIHAIPPLKINEDALKNFGPPHSFSRGRGRIPSGGPTPKFGGGGQGGKLFFCPPINPPLGITSEA